MIEVEFLEYELTSQLLCLGERIKKGTFRPCVKTIPYSQITGALRANFGKDNIHAVGHFISDEIHNKVDFLTFSPKDRGLRTSKIPLTVEFLSDVLGRIYIIKKDNLNLPLNISLSMGALKSRGFGKCNLRFLKTIIDLNSRKGKLRTRIPLDVCELFGIKNIAKPFYGYLFRPISQADGVYILSLFESSKVFGPEFLLEED